jgi:hypothetical protein
MDGKNTEDEQVTVSENKFNGTSTFRVKNAPSADHAKAFARKFWREEYDTRPSKIVVEQDTHMISTNQYTVMVADHSSGSLKQSKQYEKPETDGD